MKRSYRFGDTVIIYRAYREATQNCDPKLGSLVTPGRDRSASQN